MSKGDLFMITAIDRSKTLHARRFSRSVLSRYLWRLGPGIYAGAHRSLRDRIMEELTDLAKRSKSTHVTIITSDANEPKGVKIEVIKSNIFG